jgi:membrane associated rhomboid family serine protease
MALSTRPYFRNANYGDLLPRAIKGLLIANAGIFLLQFFAGNRLGDFFSYFALYPIDVVRRGFLWQPVTYMFLHGNVWHILWNMLALWMFGRDLELHLGTRRFLKFYFVCGTGAGVCVVVANYLFGDPRVATIGASGAIYGILLASAVLWPDRVILFNFLIPIKMKYYVIIIGALAFIGSFNLNSGVSEIAHLTGMLWGYIYLKARVPGRRSNVDPLGMLRDRYRAWKLARAKKRFQVYLRKHGSGRGPWVQ